jgi:hypothetical protein
LSQNILNKVFRSSREVDFVTLTTAPWGANIAENWLTKIKALRRKGTNNLMAKIETFTAPVDLDVELNHVNYNMGLPYYCWHCNKADMVPKDEAHECLQSINNEEVLANPYTTHLIEETFKIALRNRSFDLSKLTLLRGVSHPLVGVVLSMIFGIHKDKREEWLKNVPNVNDEIHQKMIDF